MNCDKSLTYFGVDANDVNLEDLPDLPFAEFFHRLDRFPRSDQARSQRALLESAMRCVLQPKSVDMVLFDSLRYSLGQWNYFLDYHQLL